MSPLSDIHSSLYDSDALDPLSSLQSYSADLFTSGPSASQQTITSGSDPDFIQPPSAPPTLKRVGPGRIKTWILYSDMSKGAFIEWWLQTMHGSECGDKKTFNWDRTRQLSDVWNHFDQVAHHTTGLPKVMCQRCGKTLDHPSYTSHGTNSMGRHWKGEKCRKATSNAGKQLNIRQLVQDAGCQPSNNTRVFSKERWEEEIVTTVTMLRLPFQIVEHPQFQSLLQLSQSAPALPDFPSAKTIQRRLFSTVKERHQSLLRTLPPNAKISIALDCWTSPFQQAFMAVTGYFIDQDWNYREVLLGFEPLYGTHSGTNLSSVLFGLLQQHQIADRVLAITTDNASNNHTLVSSIQESVQLLELNHDTIIIRIPCIAHVIQLSLRQLLGQMKADPKNEVTKTEWSEVHSISLHTQPQEREIANTLNKVRNLAVFVNASPQRREAFCSLQAGSAKLLPIQDVRTRWNSTFLMLRRAKRLQSMLDRFCTQYGHPHLMLGPEEWRQIEYLLWITQPFFKFTTALSKTKDVTIHSVFGIYNKLFEHLETSIQQLQRKRSPWKQLMLSALHAAKEKLSFYYSKTDEIHSDLYAIGTIIAPQNKLQFFSGKDWDDESYDWRKRYLRSLQNYLEPYKQRLSENQFSSKTLPLAVPTSELDLLLMPAESHQQKPGQSDELTDYLESGTLPVAPCAFWKDHQDEYPALASLARDVLSIPATGAGVERLFNSARDVCHYRRGSLNAKTIQDLMMFMCTTKFDIEEKELAFLGQFLSKEEREAANEEKEAQGQDNLDPISDNEEDDPVCIQDHQQLSLDKGQRNPTSTTLESEDDLPLPANLCEEGNTQQRMSGRARKRSRLLNGFELGRW